MKQLFLVLVIVCASGAVDAQEFQARADRGERLMATRTGDDYIAAIAPALEQSVRSCDEAGSWISPGDTVTLVAQVSSDGGWSAVQTEPSSPAAACLSRRLQASRLPAPVGWDWSRGEFPLTLSVGAGRGTVNGVRQGD
jgi:hypothetical protein